jgi:hypothetical protein
MDDSDNELYMNGDVSVGDFIGIQVVNFLSEYQFSEARERYRDFNWDVYADYVCYISMACDQAVEEGFAVLIGKVVCDELDEWAQLCAVTAGSSESFDQYIAPITFAYEGCDSLWAVSNSDTAVALAEWCGRRSDMDFDCVVESAARAWNPLTALFEELIIQRGVICFSTAVDCGDNEVQIWAVDTPVVCEDGYIVVQSDAHMDALIRMVTLGFVNGGTLVLRCFYESETHDSQECQSVYGWGLSTEGLIPLSVRSLYAICGSQSCQAWDDASTPVYCDTTTLYS